MQEELSEEPSSLFELPPLSKTEENKDELRSTSQDWRVLKRNRNESGKRRNERNEMPRKKL
jgi:hypothetical protein